MNLNSAGVLTVCVLAASLTTAEPLYVSSAVPAKQLAGHGSVVRMILPESAGDDFADVQDNLDYSGQLYAAILRTDSGATRAAREQSDLYKHSSEVFKTLEMPTPQQLLDNSPEAQERYPQRNTNGTGLGVGITAEMVIKDLAKDIRQEMGVENYTSTGSRAAETAGFLAVSNDEFSPQAQRKAVQISSGKLDITVTASDSSPILLVLLCKLGLMRPGPLGLDDDCE
jgi:hypothetical protein